MAVVHASAETSAVELPAVAGRAVRVTAGDRVRVIDRDGGGQVGDVLAFTDAEHHSASHTRAATSRLFPAVDEQAAVARRTDGAGRLHQRRSRDGLRCRGLACPQDIVGISAGSLSPLVIEVSLSH
jgi:uncharacterized protein YcgI (DUF1989 family)